mmetsp:Transcript_5410/g.7643  ORF Transcript_5410/g.7643 Transcript_5410/m.7643 type:complete len:145 (+) Transcript_5410:97-531(+)
MINIGEIVTVFIVFLIIISALLPDAAVEFIRDRILGPFFTRLRNFFRHFVRQQIIEPAIQEVSSFVQDHPYTSSLSSVLLLGKFLGSALLASPLIAGLTLFHCWFAVIAIVSVLAVVKLLGENSNQNRNLEEQQADNNNSNLNL